MVLMKKVLLYLALVLTVAVCMCACKSTSATETTARTAIASFSYVHDPRLNPEAMKDIVENPDAVSQEMLDALAKRIRDKHDNDKVWQREKFVPTYKDLNGGSIQYKNIESPATRLAVYNALYAKFKEDIIHD